eukprot:TRINITY_DN1583_c0_g3_i1.p1 TRINITY_DN1583_c0_g3~~TRINITY_DN1583_c0_g3_i1.p1  ORF type:complete len:169 (+),score=29.52 TRINITY_DN1583_c0_g3_i1:87-593(+)
MALYELTIPVFIKTLHNLSRFVDKGASYATTKKFDVEVLLHARLAPDQFNFIRQIQIACDVAKFCGARLTGKEAPSFDDKEKTLEEVKARIEKTIEYLKTFKSEDFKGAEDKQISQPRWEGKHMKGSDYAAHHVIPNFYFHVTTAYAILRHNGVELGKADFLGDMPLK